MRYGRILGIAVAASVVAIAPAVSAQAAVSAAATDVNICVEVYGPPAVQDSILLENKCGKTVKVKIVMAHGSDSPCHTLANNGEWIWKKSWLNPGRFDGLKTC